jgi:regulator of protease activity HflC (stomatin/prohibitin superfamily)
MAIDWKIKFTQKPNGHYSAVFQRFDTLSPDVVLQTVSILDAILDTQEQQDALWNQVKAEQERQAAVNGSEAALETDAKTALLAKEG